MSMLDPHLAQVSDAFLAAVIASSDDAIVSKSLEGVVQSWNKSAERIFGYTADEMVGQLLIKIIPEDRRHEEVDILSRLRRGERIDHFQTIRRRKDGQLIHVSVTVSPVRDRNGAIIGASKIARDITAAVNAAKECEELLQREQQARQEAERISRGKDEFLWTISHELRTPLNAILGWVHLLKAGAVPSSEMAYAYETIERNAKTQTQLIDDLLDVSRIISGKLRLEMQPLDLPPIVQAGVDAIRATADSKKIALQTTIAPDLPQVRGDPARLQQVLWNLLSNAVKYTPEHGRVRLTIERLPGRVRIVVADTGQGIPADFLPRLFERFAQADGSTTRRHGGLGLGLALVRHLVELHGGTVQGESPGKDQGATFTVTLPAME